MDGQGVGKVSCETTASVKTRKRVTKLALACTGGKSSERESERSTANVAMKAGEVRGDVSDVESCGQQGHDVQHK